MAEQNQSSEHDRLIRCLLSSRKKAEALAWLKHNRRTDERTLGVCKTNRDSIRFMKETYDAGAEEVIAVRIRKILRQNSHRTGKLVTKLPAVPKSRKAILTRASGRVIQWDFRQTRNGERAICFCSWIEREIAIAFF
jgi:hypothetical protein